MQIFIALFLLTFIIFTKAQTGLPCNDPGSQINCSLCTQNVSCGWCAANKRCFTGNSQGINVTDNNGLYCDVGWIYQPNECIDECSVLAQDCFDCQAIQHINCVWTKYNQCKAKSMVPDPSYIVANCSCGMFKTCRECSAHKLGNCTFCPHLGQCLSMAEAQQQQCKFRFDGVCPCNTSTSCLSCMENPVCSWCTSQGFCFGDEPVKRNCSLVNFGPCSAICPGQKTCKDCMTIEGVSCAWCKNTTGSYCMDIIITDVCNVESCQPPPSGGGFDGGSFVGGMFLALGLVGIAGAGYWYATRRSAYKPLN